MTEHGVTEHRIQVETETGMEDMVYLKRSNGTKVHVHAVPILLDHDEMLTAQVIRNICGGLKLSPKPFGLPLD